MVQNTHSAARTCAHVHTCMFLPNLAETFFYSKPSIEWFKKGLKGALKSCFIWFVARDLHSAATFCRRCVRAEYEWGLLCMGPTMSGSLFVATTATWRSTWGLMCEVMWHNVCEGNKG